MYCYEVLVFAKATQITAPARARFNPLAAFLSQTRYIFTKSRECDAKPRAEGRCKRFIRIRLRAANLMVHMDAMQPRSAVFLP